MDRLRLRIPFEFIRDRVRMTWRDLLFGIDEHLLDPTAPVSFAIDRVMNEKVSEPEVIELAGLVRERDARPYLERIAARAPEEALDDIRAKWLCLVLAWIYAERGTYPDPLQKVEEVYADFGYPPGMAGFVRYMPLDGTDLGSREQNEARLYARWEQFVNECLRTHATDRARHR
jgi:hypothetical protein